MELSDKQIKRYTKQNAAFFSTSSIKGQLRSIFVCPSKIEKDRIIISDMNMEITSQNLEKNDKVFMAFFNNDFTHSLKISGTAKYYNDGVIFDEMVMLEKNHGYNIKGIIVVNIDEIKEENEI